MVMAYNNAHRLLFYALPNHTSACASHCLTYAYGGEMEKDKTCIRNGKYGLYFIEPQPNTNAKELAYQLLGLDDVVEVQITSGEVGYIVAAKKDSYSLEKFIRKNALKSRYVESHYIISKR